MFEMPLKHLRESDLEQELLYRCGRVFGSDIDDVLVGLQVARFAHESQFRQRISGATEPYIMHPLRNAVQLLRWGINDRESVIAALLHDTVEDQFDRLLLLVPDSSGDFSMGEPKAVRKNKAFGCVREIFGRRVESRVQGLTYQRPHGVSGEEAFRADYAKHVLDACTNDTSVLVVKAADLKDNAGTLGDGVQYYLNTHRVKVEALALKYRPVVEGVIQIIEHQPGVLLFDDNWFGIHGLLSDMHVLREYLDKVLSDCRMFASLE